MKQFDPSLDIVKQPQERLLSSRSFVELIRAVLDKGAVFRLRARGMSMYPFIHDGDILTLGRENHFREGDVLAFPHPQTGGLVIHRLVKRRNRLLMKGDYNSLPDGWLARGQILAKVVRVERNGRVVQPAHHGLRRLIALISIGSGVRWCRWSILKRLKKLGDFY